MKKIKRFLLIFLLIVMVLLLTKTSYALGATPARVDINYVPGLETNIGYSIFEDNPKKELDIYATGDLAEYVEFDKNKLVGSGTFIATLKLPEHIEKPGLHKIFIFVKEKIDEEIVGTVGTSVTIGTLVVIHVPLPGKYLELTLESHNVNVGEPVNFILQITSQGTEDINITPRIDITPRDNQGKVLETLYFKNREIKSQQVLKLKKTLDTTDYNPGKYKAIAIVDYGKIAKAESDFKIGELIINIVNYTKKIVIGKIKAFDIDIESGWNNHIDGAYAQVSIFNNSETLISFKTSSTQLTPWEKKTITGFFDASNFTKGIYDTNITIIYYGKDRGRSTSEMVKVEFVEKIKPVLIVWIIVGIIVLVAGVFLVKKYLLRNKKKK
jgi:hypothetical protein